MNRLICDPLSSSRRALKKIKVLEKDREVEGAGSHHKLGGLRRPPP